MDLWQAAAAQAPAAHVPQLGPVPHLDAASAQAGALAATQPKVCVCVCARAHVCVCVCVYESSKGSRQVCADGASCLGAPVHTHTQHTHTHTHTHTHVYVYVYVYISLSLFRGVAPASVPCWRIPRTWVLYQNVCLRNCSLNTARWAGPSLHVIHVTLFGCRGGRIS